MNADMANTTKLIHAVHPFYPSEVEIVGYLANQWSVPILLGIFAGGTLSILSVTLAFVKRFNKNVQSSDQAAILWFVLCKWRRINCAERTQVNDLLFLGGSIHLFFEGGCPSQLTLLRLVSEGDRLLCLQSHPHGRHARPVRTAVERILSLRLALLDIRSIRSLYGNHHSCS